MSSQPPQDLRAALAAFTHAVSSSDPSERDYIKVVRPGDEFAYGSVTQPLNDGFELDRSGMWLPRGSARPRGPIERAFAYITPDELLGYTMPFDRVLQNLRKVPRMGAVNFAASLLAERNAPGARIRDGDVEFVNKYLNDPWKTRALNLLREPHRALIVPQALHLLVKLALLVCPHNDGPDEPVDMETLLLVLLCLPAHLDSGVEQLDEDEEHIVGSVAGPMEQYLVANHMFNSHIDIMTALAVFHRCWNEIPTEHPHDTRMVDLPAEYEAATGVPLGDLSALCVMLWAGALGGTPCLRLEDVNVFGWSAERFERALNLISCSADEMTTNIVNAEKRFGLVWTKRDFAYRPVIRWDNHVTVIDPELVLHRATGMWPMMDIARFLEPQGSGGKKSARRIRAAVDRAHEVFALEVFAAIAGRGRLYGEDDLSKVYGRRTKVCDVVVDYGHAWVVADITTTGFQDESAAGTNPEAVHQDLNKAVEKARQLEATIKNLRSDASKLTKDNRSVPARRFYPVLVIATRFPTSPITMTMLWERLREEDLLQGHDVAPLEVMELDDLCAAEGAVESGHSLVSLLEDKRTSPMERMSMRDYLQDKLHGVVRQPQRVVARWQKVFEPVIEVVRRNAA